MIFDIADVEDKIGYQFKNKSLLRQCFTHASYANENKSKDNERLEFLGDAILGFVITEHLYLKFEKCDEGDLTELKKHLVSKEPLQNAVFNCGLDEHLIMGKGQAENAKNDQKLFSSLFESLVAGIYFDGGLLSAKKFIFAKLKVEELIDGGFVAMAGKKQKGKGKVAESSKEKMPTQIPIVEKNIKTQLQELSQSLKKGFPVYKDLEKSGPDHKPVFTVELLIDGKSFAKATGESKKKAQINCAEIAYKKLKKVKK